MSSALSQFPDTSYPKPDTYRSPGRFFASQQLKLLLANILLKYDIKPISKRPNNRWLNNTIGPDVWATLQVRRRSDAVLGIAEGIESDSGRSSGRLSEEFFRPSGQRRTQSEHARNMC